jgi:two-component system sensor histidine kinase PilS (NtrC family)
MTGHIPSDALSQSGLENEAAFLKETANPSTELGKKWRPLHFLNLYRLLLAGIFVILIFSNVHIKPFGLDNTELFQIVSIGYLIATILFGITIRWHWPSFNLQIHTHIIVDFIALLLIMYASGGVKSGVGLLLLIPIAAISILSMGRSSLFYAAIISLILLLDQTYLHIRMETAASYAQAGLLGGVLFLTAWLTNYLVNKTEESVEIASQREVDLANMEQLTQFIMQRMQTAVIVVDYLGNVRLINDTATNLLKFPGSQSKKTKQPKFNLYEYSLELGEMFQNWKAAPDTLARHLKLKNSSLELTLRFASLGDNADSGAVIFIEDNAVLSQQAQQLKLASLGRLTASIAHELRNPLAAIRHAGELLHESPSLEVTDKRLTEIIEKQSVRVNEIIGTVLDLSRRQKAEQEELNLNHWIKEFLNEYIQLPKERFYLKFETDDLMVTFDPQHLHQIFNNLIQNALRHSEEHQQHFRPVVVAINRDKKTSLTYLQVMNYGKKIPEENRDQLFEPFFTTESTGTGLGLYIASELAECNSAKLEYINIKDGACFQLSFADPRRKQTTQN